MLSATTFTYDGVFSGTFGVRIASIATEYIQDTAPFNYIVHAVKTHKRKRFSFAGIENEDMPKYEFSIISETAIPDLIRRELLSWLVGRNGFRKLQFHQADYQNIEYNCIFAQTGLKFINGNCHGINLTAIFDSPYCYGRPNKKTVRSDGFDWVNIKLINDSDILDDYVYPIVKFNANGLTDDNSLSVINLSDKANPHRVFEYGITMPTETVTIDNELRIITSNIGGDKLGQFNKNWLRLMPGVNELRLRINGVCAIECPTFIKIGF